MKTIYLDYNATTPCDPRVLASMQPYFSEKFGNSMSTHSSYGWDAEEAVDESRRKIAKHLGVRPHELTFTSGATEANNWAIRGLIEQIRRDEGTRAKIHILSSPVEHASVLRCLEQVEKVYDVEVEYLAINSYGQINIEDLKRRLRPETRLVCAIWVNNEIGSINPISDLVRVCRAHGVLVHADATQALGKIPLDLKTSPVDMMSFSAHKLYGPKGIGFLYHRASDPHVRLQPLICGGGHERGQRSGTLNVPGIVGMATALDLAMENFKAETQRLSALAQQLWLGLQKHFPEVRLNGAVGAERSPVNLNLTFPHAPNPVHLPGLAVSQSSACSSGKVAGSHVLRALGLSEEESRSTLRMTVGRWTSPEDISQAIEIIDKYMRHVRAEMEIH